MAKSAAKPNPTGTHLNKREAQTMKERHYLRMFTRIYVIFVLALYPLYTGAEKYGNIVYRKAHVYWIFSVLFIVGFTLFFIPYYLGKPKSFGEKKPFWKLLGVPEWAALAFFFIITLSAILSDNQDTVWLGFNNRHDGWLTMFCMIGCFVIISRWYRPSHADFALFAVSSSVMGIIALLQFYSIDIFSLYPTDGTDPYFGFNILYRTTIGNVDFLGCYAGMAVLAFMGLYIKTEKKIRFLYFFASVISFVTLMVSNVYQGRVGVAGACVLLVPFWLADRKTFGKFLIMLSGWAFTYWLHHWFLFDYFLPSLGEAAPRVGLRSIFPSRPMTEMLVLGFAGLAVGLALEYLKQVKWPKLKTVQIVSVILLAVMLVGGLAAIEIVGAIVPAGNIFYQAREILHGNFADNFGSGRGIVWRLAMGRIGEHAIIGAGPDSFYHAFGDENQRATREFMGVVFDKAHNDFLQVVICYGVGGLLSYLALVGSIVLLSVKKAFSDDFLVVALGAALSYLVGSFFSIDTVIVTPIFWLFLAFARSAHLAQPGDTDRPIGK